MGKIVQRRIRRQGKGTNQVADINAAVATNRAKDGDDADTATSTRQRLRIVQRGGRTTVSEEISE
jgi:hypothetical protein